MNTEKVKKSGDKYHTPVAKLLHPICEACKRNPTTVGHHFVERSRSNLLRHDTRNIIGLCQPCHTKIHNLFGNNNLGSYEMTNQIIASRGEKWYKEIRSLEHKSIKADILFWTKEVDKLKQQIYG